MAAVRSRPSGHERGLRRLAGGRSGRGWKRPDSVTPIPEMVIIAGLPPVLPTRWTGRADTRQGAPPPRSRSPRARLDVRHPGRRPLGRDDCRGSVLSVACYIGHRLPSGPVAQLGARLHGMEEVEGSSPSRSTTVSSRTRCFDAAFAGASLDRERSPVALTGLFPSPSLGRQSRCRVRPAAPIEPRCPRARSRSIRRQGSRRARRSASRLARTARSRNPPGS